MTRIRHANLFLNERGELVMILPKAAEVELLEAVIQQVKYVKRYETTDGRSAFVLSDPRNSVTLKPADNGADLIMRVTNLL